VNPSSVNPATLEEWLLGDQELAVLDAREQGVYFDSHLFHAACVPLSQLELLLGNLVPRLSTRLVWCDDGTEPDGSRPLAQRAAERAIALGWTNVHVLNGGTTAWAAAGGELYSGVNVASKAFGEYVEHCYNTPRIPATELAAKLSRGEDLVVLDSRPIEEFRRMSIPSGTDCPGAELVHRVKDMVDTPDTLVVVNCAGRTRSIIGAQSLINAGLENQVVALENGTMGWELAGFEVERGNETSAPSPSGSAREWATQAAARVGSRFGVRLIDRSELQVWQTEGTRTTFLLDVRTPQEFEAGHLPGSANAPGGQLVQATDEYVATRNARIVVVDDDGVRATMTASWLRQLGWVDCVVLEGGVGSAGLQQGLAPRKQPAASQTTSPTISVSELAERLADEQPRLAVLDLGTSIKYRRKGHIPGAFWGVRSRLDQAKAAMDPIETLILTSSDGRLAKLAVADAKVHWPNVRVLALAGGTRAWRHAGHQLEPGFTAPTTEANDVWYKPYDHSAAVAKQHMRDYLTWEVALVEQLDRDPTVSFPTFS